MEAISEGEPIVSPSPSTITKTPLIPRDASHSKRDKRTSFVLKSAKKSVEGPLTRNRAGSGNRTSIRNASPTTKIVQRGELEDLSDQTRASPRQRPTSAPSPRAKLNQAKYQAEQTSPSSPLSARSPKGQQLIPTAPAPVTPQVDSGGAAGAEAGAALVQQYLGEKLDAFLGEADLDKLKYKLFKVLWQLNTETQARKAAHLETAAVYEELEDLRRRNRELDRSLQAAVSAQVESRSEARQAEAKLELANKAAFGSDTAAAVWTVHNSSVEKAANERVQEAGSEVAAMMVRMAELQVEVREKSELAARHLQQCHQVERDANVRINEAEQRCEKAERKMTIMAGQVEVLRGEAQELRVMKKQLNEEARKKRSHCAVRPWQIVGALQDATADTGEAPLFGTAEWDTLDPEEIATGTSDNAAFSTPRPASGSAVVSRAEGGGSGDDTARGQAWRGALYNLNKHHGWNAQEDDRVETPGKHVRISDLNGSRAASTPGRTQSGPKLKPNRFSIARLREEGRAGDMEEAAGNDR